MADAVDAPEALPFGPEAPPRVVLSSEHAVTAERIAALPEEERGTWEQYIARSVERRRAEQVVLDAEVLAAGLVAPRLAPAGDDFRLPSHVTAAGRAATCCFFSCGCRSRRRRWSRRSRRGWRGSRGRG